MSTTEHNLAALRAELKHRSLDGFIVPLTDEHMSEYVGDYAQRLHWLTGFAGSAGNGAVLMDKAAVFIDGRYTIQVQTEVDGTLFERLHFEDVPMVKWITSNAPKGAKIGYDPELATIKWVETTTEKFAQKGITLVATETNPIDSVWESQPDPSLAPAYPHPESYAGATAGQKRTEIAADLRAEGVDAAVITMLDSVAWAFNIRSEDVLNTPVAHAFAILKSDESAILFVDDRKIDDTLRRHLGNNVQIEPRTAFYAELKKLGDAGSNVLVDTTTNNAKVFKTLKEAGANLREGEDPCIIKKAVKNPVEQQGSRDAHLRDGAAIVEFLCWLDKTAPSGEVDELKAAAKLWSLREKRALIKDRSFDTISAAGPNAAMAHYRVNEKSNLPLEMDKIYLVDSGGQYLDGTTDITRTIIVGTPTDEMKDRFTRVLKGHIALATTRFPKGTSGMAIDCIARRPLWDAGLDFDHGTGHGVGSFLAVHEGPQRIAKFGTSVPLQPGMILSNEPGYYKAGEYGIRIENLVLVNSADKTEERQMMEFETLTFAPIDKRLIEESLLTAPEKDWLNSYHAAVYKKISPQVEGETAEWLKAATAAL